MSDTPSIELAPRPGRWIAKPRKPRPAIFIGSLSFVYGQLITQAIRYFEGKEGAAMGLWIAGSLATIFSVGAIVRSVLAQRIRPADRAAMDGAFGDQFVVELTFTSGNKSIGADRGVIWFADGLMGFSGRASSFVLAASDLGVRNVEVTLRGLRRGFIRPNKIPLGAALSLIDAPAPISFFVIPLKGCRTGFWKRLERFLTADEKPEGERFWPPLEPYGADDKRSLA